MPYYYEIFGISQDASCDEIKKANNRLAKNYHPDIKIGSNYEVAQEKMKEINNIYSILSEREHDPNLVES